MEIVCIYVWGGGEGGWGVVSSWFRQCEEKCVNRKFKVNNTSSFFRVISRCPYFNITHAAKFVDTRKSINPGSREGWWWWCGGREI